MSQRTYRCAARKSQLARLQAELVLAKLDLAAECVGLHSEGDLKADWALSRFTESGVFTSELEAALLAGEVDFCVHSLKDLPSVLAPGTTLAAIGPREDARDVLVMPRGSGVKALEELPFAAKIGSSSARRRLQLALLRPDLQLADLRGNVPTRLQKLADGQFAGILLALAGVKRLGLLDDPRFDFLPLPAETMIPACGQAALAVQCRSDDRELLAALAAYEDPESRAAYAVERRVQAHFAKTCHAPVAAYCARDAEGYWSLLALNGTGGAAYVRRVAQRISREPGGPVDEGLLRQALRALAGQVYLLGAGPGDVEFLHTKARRILATADVVLFDRLDTSQVLSLCPATAELIYVGKARAAHSLSQAEITALLTERARGGQTVVRLKGGDPLTFGRAAEEARALLAEDLPVTIVPALSSALAGPAQAGMALTERGEASAFTVLTGQRAADLPGLDPDNLPKAGNLIVLMGLAELERNVAAILAAGRSPETPAMLVEKASLPGQRQVRGTLADIVDKGRAAAIAAPALLLVGPGVAFAEVYGPEAAAAQAQRYPTGPLMGRRFWLTRPAELPAGAEAAERASAAANSSPSLAERLRAAGAEVLELPLQIFEQTAAQRAALAQLIAELIREAEHAAELGPDFEQVVVLSSPRAVALFGAAFQAAGGDWRQLRHCRFAVTGEGTAKALRALGLKADLQPRQHFAADSLGRTVLSAAAPKAHLYYLHALETSGVLLEALRASARALSSAAVYQLRTRVLAPSTLNYALEHCDSLIVTSASAGRALLAAAATLGLSPADLTAKRALYVLGPLAAKALRGEGALLRPLPPKATQDELLACILDDAAKLAETSEDRSKKE